MSRRTPRRTAILASAATALALLAPTPGMAQDEGESFQQTVTSRAVDEIDIDIQVYRPAGASADNPVPVLLHSHGWGGSKSSGANSFSAEREAGYGVVSISQRGHGASEGLRSVEDPEFEGQDMMAVVDYIATLDWVAREDYPAGEADPFAAEGGDILLGAWGGSYGGGYQYVLAGTEMMEYGATRMDVMAPDITWHDLNQALAPQDVPRSAWLTLLYASAAWTVEPYISQGFAYGVATGMYSDGTVPGQDLKGEFVTHGPAGYVDHLDADGDGDTTDMVTFDIPMLITQGFSDNLFNFTEAWDNFHQSLTPEAQEQSVLVGHNGGHALPNVYPVGFAAGGDHCSNNTTTTRIGFFNAAFAGENPRETVGGGETYHFATASGECYRFNAEDVTSTPVTPTELDPSGTLGPATGNVSMFGAPIHLELAEGPFTFGGVPVLTADAYGLGVDQRVFFALSKGPSGFQGVGTSPQVIQNNTTPYRSLLPPLGESISLDLAGVSDTIDEGESLYLTISPFSDMFFGHGGRAPGGVGFTDVSVDLPVISDEIAPQ